MTDDQLVLCEGFRKRVDGKKGFDRDGKRFWGSTRVESLR